MGFNFNFDELDKRLDDLGRQVEGHVNTARDYVGKRVIKLGAMVEVEASTDAHESGEGVLPFPRVIEKGGQLVSELGKVILHNKSQAAED